MPRKSSAAAVSLDPRGQRLEPPPSLSKAEREAFVAYVAAQAQERAISRKLEAVEDEKAEAVLWAAHARVAGSLTRLARALRLGAMARNPSRHRRGVAPLPEPSGSPPWEYRPSEKPN
jgi:hypothetical protein